ncbi:MAG TPA: type II toxin-antitoxin system ParD family antitoxin [Kaistia sp.]|jgi:antitoxin ParD1/3/4|nr:type II toxin-antitoxin system ParD family antitoxin [Kaistia sp.]
MPTRNISLADALDDLVEEEVRSGRYQNAREVVRAGLGLFEQRKQENTARLRALDRAIDVATEQAERGEYVPVEDLDAFVDGMVARMEAAEGVLRKTGRG